MDLNRIGDPKYIAEVLAALSHAGLAFVGKYLKRININALIDPAFAVRSGVVLTKCCKITPTELKGRSRINRVRAQGGYSA